MDPQLMRLHCVRPQVAQIGAGAEAIPQVVRGVVGMMREFDSLQYMSWRKSVPVAYLQAHHFRTLNQPVLADYLAATQVNPNLHVPPDAQLLVPAHNPALALKVDNIRAMVQVSMSMIDFL